MTPRWLEEMLLAVGEDALRSALAVAIEAGDLGEHGNHRKALRAILRRPNVAKARPRAA